MAIRLVSRRLRQRSAPAHGTTRQHFSPEYINKVKAGNNAILHYQEVQKKRRRAAK